MSAPMGVPQLDARITAVEQRLAAYLGEARWLRDRLAGVHERQAYAVRRRQDRDLAAVDAAARAADAERKRDVELVERTGTAESLRLAGLLAPGRLSAAWSDPTWTGLTDLSASCLWPAVRVGSVASHPIPAVLPLVGTPGWQVDGSPDQFAALLQSVVLRMLATLGPHRFAVTTYDPGLTSGVGMFAEVRAAAPDSVPAAITAPAELDEALDSLLEHIADVDDQLAQRGGDSVLGSGSTYGVRLLAVHDGHGDLPEDIAARLSRVARTGGSRGVSVIVRSGKRLDGLAAVRLGSPATAAPLQGIGWHPDPAPDRDLTGRVCLALGEAAPSSPVVPFGPIVDAMARRWIDPGLEGVTAVIGERSGTGRTRPLAVELRSEEPAMPNALVGGAVGSGKSNLLLVLIHALAAQYSPQELEMVLLDFRDGVEFAPLGPQGDKGHWLPHAILLGLETDQEFGVAVLDDMSRELARRTAEFKRVGVGKINAYRAKTGLVMPRRLLVIDEFQRLFSGSDELADRAVALLDDLSRTGRAAGFHLVLSSQTVSGIRALATRGDAIFSQFHHRISLRNTAAESAAILSPRNVAAASLSGRGKVIVNSSLGLPDGDANVTGTVALAQESELAQLRRQLWVESGSRTPPYVFVRSAPALRGAEVSTLVRNAAAAAPGCLALCPGAPISVRDRGRVVTLGRGGEQGICLLGTDTAVVLLVLGSLVLDAREQGYATTLLDGRGGSPLTDLPVDTVVTGADVRPAATRLLDPSSSDPTLVLLSGLDGLDLETADLQTFRTGADDIRQLVARGPARGLWTVSWWESRPAAERVLGYQLEGVRAWAFCGAAKDDITQLCGPLFAPPEGSPRLLWHDRLERRPETLIPFGGAA